MSLWNICKKSKYNKILNVLSLSLYFVTFSNKKAYKVIMAFMIHLELNSLIDYTKVCANFADTMNQLCPCFLEIESTEHYFLPCQKLIVQMAY